ncbi:MAG: hypothetical protein WEB53_04280 [Akkermansiaceae bacterium]
MKPLALTAGAFAIAIICGGGGYLIGKRESARSTPSIPAETTVSRPVNSSEAAKRSSAASVDPKALIDALNQESNPLRRFNLALQNLEAWVGKDSKGALDWLAGQPASERRNDVIRMALNQFAGIDAKAAADWAMKNQSGVDLNNSLIAIAEDWAGQNGREAAAWFLTLPTTLERDAAVENIFFSWASNEPAAALEFLTNEPAIGELAPTLRRAALAGWVKSDPLAAVAASLNLSRANQDPGQFANTLANWATVNLEGSSQWLLTNLPTGSERLAATSELAVIFAQQSPEAGVAWLAKLEPGTERAAAASSLAAAWSRSGPLEAAKWAASQTHSELSAESVSDIGYNLLMKDPAAFESWKSALPAGPLKENIDRLKAPAVGED